MKLKLLKLGLGAIFLISLASLGAILLFINPYRAGGLMLVLFSLAALMLGFSFFSWFGFWLRQKFVNQRNLNRILKIVFRQGAMLALLGLGYLWLAHFKMFKVWTSVPLLFLIIAAEYYFLLARHQYTNPPAGRAGAHE